MSQTPKTIQIFLPSGDPQGIRIAEITTRILQVIEVPRSLLQDFAKMPESKQVGVYFLFGESDEDDEPRVYIGQSGDLNSRFTIHNKKKEFWERALIIVSKTNSLTQTHAVFLEWHCIRVCRKVGRYADENGNSGSKPHTPAPLEADCLEIFDTAKTLLATLGYPLFDPVVKPEGTSDEEETFYCTASGSDGRGLYTTEGFVVLKGSIGRKAISDGMVGSAAERRRQKVLMSDAIKEIGDTIEFQKDYLFRSPSMASFALCGRSTNGWKDWKNKAGKTLDEVKRQVADS